MYVLYTQTHLLSTEGTVDFQDTMGTADLFRATICSTHPCETVFHHRLLEGFLIHQQGVANIRGILRKTNTMEVVTFGRNKLNDVPFKIHDQTMNRA